MNQASFTLSGPHMSLTAKTFSGSLKSLIPPTSPRGLLHRLNEQEQLELSPPIRQAIRDQRSGKTKGPWPSLSPSPSPSASIGSAPVMCHNPRNCKETNSTSEGHLELAIRLVHEGIRSFRWILREHATMIFRHGPGMSSARLELVASLLVVLLRQRMTSKALAIRSHPRNLGHGKIYKSGLAGIRNNQKKAEERIGAPICGPLFRLPVVTSFQSMMHTRAF